MADNQIGEVGFNFTNSLKSPGQTADDNLMGDYTNIDTMRTALSTFDATTYTEAVLNTMSVNDMVFALRSIKDPKTLADYISAQVARTTT
jgi:hypothetical protein